MKQFYSLSLVFLSLTAMAQYPGDPPRFVAKTSGVDVSGKITGVVIDSVAQTPVEFANVALVDNQTKKPIDGAVCDIKGEFTISKVKEGNYTIVVSFIGFENKSIPIKIAEKNDEINLGRIILAPSAEILKEVVVEGVKSLIEERVDRTIYNAENDATARGGDATDVLKRVPMLSVDLDGNVSMRGSSNIKVLINNKPSTIAASSVADALKMIPADQIKSVEVITSPSAKYDAEGSGGIINIITKKNTLQGVNLNVDVSAGMRGSNLGLNGSYRKKNMGFSLGGFGRSNYNVTGKFQNVQTTNGNIVNTQSASSRNEGLFGHYNLGWDYDVNKNNSLAASVRFGVRNNNSFQDDLLTTSENLSTNETTGTLGDIDTKDASNNVDASLTYTHTFETPQREFSILSMYSRNNRTNDFINNSVDLNSEILSRRKNLNESYNQEVTVQVDYQTPIGKTQMVEFGGKSITRKVSSDYKYFQAAGDDEFTPSTVQQPNVFDYNQNVTGGYLSYTLSFLKSYSLKAGGRYEYTTIDANFQNASAGEDVSKIPSYGAFVPSVNVSKKLKNGNMVKLAYNRRLQRPSIQFLNPNVQSTNNLNSTQGNPNLSPEYTDNYELSYSTYIKGSSLNFSGFMRNTDNSIQSLRDVLANNPDDPDTIRTTYRNIGEEHAYGINVFANVNIGSKFSLNGGSDLYYTTLTNNVADPLYNSSNKGWVVSYRIFGSYTLGKGWAAQFFGFYRGRQVQLQGTQGGFGIYSLGLRKEFNERKGTIGFGAENFFTPEFRIKNQNSSPILVQNSVNTMHLMNFKITFSYRIGKMSFDAPKRRKSINNDDLKDGGGGDNGGGGSMQQQGQTQQQPTNNTRQRQGQDQRQNTQSTPAQEKPK